MTKPITDDFIRPDNWNGVYDDSSYYGLGNGTVGCALPDLGRVMLTALGVVVLAVAVTIGMWQRMKKLVSR